MEIKKFDKNSVLIDSRNGLIAAYVPKDFTQEVALSLGTELKGAYNIVTQGEYETKEIWVMALNTDPQDLNESDIFVLNADILKILILKAGVELNSRIIERIGIVDVMISYFSKDFKDQVKNVFEVDPKILLPLYEDDSIKADLAKELGVLNVTEEKKLKCKSEDFSSEEYTLSMVNLI